MTYTLNDAQKETCTSPTYKLIVIQLQHSGMTLEELNFACGCGFMYPGWIGSSA